MDENTALIGTDGLDYGNHHGRERMRGDLSDLPEEQCACCSWTILTPKKCWFKSRDPLLLLPPPTPVPPHKPPNAGIPEDWYCQQDQMKWDLGGPRAQRVKINRPDVWICECSCRSRFAGTSGERVAHGGDGAGARREEMGHGLVPIKELFHSIKLIEWNKTAKGHRLVQCPRSSTAWQRGCLRR